MTAFRIPSSAELGRSLEGVLRLIEGDARGLSLLDASPNGFVRSFLAYVWCWPAQAFLWTGVWRDVAGLRPDSLAGMVGFFAIGGTFDLLSWILPAVILYPVSGFFDFRKAYARTVVATNWFGVVATYVAFLPGTVRYLAPVPDGFAAFLSLASFGVIIWFYFRVARMALGGEALLAALVTLITLMISILSSEAAFRLMGL